MDPSDRLPFAGAALRASLRSGVCLAVGDSISIDDHTGVPGTGGASQLACKLGLDLVDFTRDGNTTRGVIVDLAAAPPPVDVVPLAAGDNDLLESDLPRSIVRRLHQIAGRIQPLGGCVILNTIYVLNVPAGDRTINQRADPSLQGRATLGYGRR